MNSVLFYRHPRASGVEGNRPKIRGPWLILLAPSRVGAMSAILWT